jgi:hypothetical protein
MEFHGQDQPEFKGSKHGRLYLTTHRMIFNAKESRDKMQSFSFPFVTLRDVSSDIILVLCSKTVMFWNYELPFGNLCVKIMERKGHNCAV